MRELPNYSFKWPETPLSKKKIQLIRCFTFCLFTAQFSFWTQWKKTGVKFYLSKTHTSAVPVNRTSLSLCYEYLCINHTNWRICRAEDTNSFNSRGAISTLCTAIAKRRCRFFRAFPREGERETRVPCAAFSRCGVSGFIVRGVIFFSRPYCKVVPVNREKRSLVDMVHLDFLRCHTAVFSPLFRRS